MQVNINKDKIVNDYATRDILNVEVDEYSEIVLCLKYRLETLEEKIEGYKNSEDKRLKEFIPKKEAEIEQLKRLIKVLEGWEMLNVVIPNNKTTLERQIKALKYVLKQDTNDKDKQIHSEALEQLEKAYEAI